MKKTKSTRRGIVAVITALFLVLLLAVLAFSLDLGVVFVAQGELQRSADAAALSAAWELAEAAVEDSVRTVSRDERIERAREEAERVAALNTVLGISPGLLSTDVEVGEYTDLEEGGYFNTASLTPNAVRVTVRRSSEINGAVPFFFARALGRQNIDQQLTATAAIATQIRGFRIRTPGENLAILPITLDEPSWDAMMAGAGSDDYSFDKSTNTVVAGHDGRREINLYPQGTGSPGNRGTVDIGSSNNSTSDISRQILSGVTQEDLDYIGGSLELNENGELELNGDTGISAGVKDELASIIGKPRMIPLFRSVRGPGNNAIYTIVRFVGVRIMNVKLTGPMNKKNVMIQPAEIVSRGIIPATETTGEPTSTFVTSPAWLIH